MIYGDGKHDNEKWLYGKFIYKVLYFHFFLNISSILKVQLVLRNPPLKIDQTSKTQGNCWALSKPIELKNKISFK